MSVSIRNPEKSGCSTLLATPPAYWSNIELETKLSVLLNLMHCVMFVSLQDIIADRNRFKFCFLIFPVFFDSMRENLIEKFSLARAQR